MTIPSGVVLCTLRMRVAKSDLQEFAAEARNLVNRAERFGARALGVYSEEPPLNALREMDDERVACAIFLTFANRAIFEQFEGSLQATALSSPAKVELLDALPGFGAPASAEPRIPYHFLKYH